MANGTIPVTMGYVAPYTMIVKQPGNSNLYYIFTAFPSPAAVTLPVPAPVITHGLYYSVVDMNLAAGMGSVIVNNALIYTAPFNLSNTGQLHATRHANGTDFWIMIHQYGNTNDFRAYQFSATGISTTAVVSSIGLFYQGGSEGHLKFSPTGQKLCTSTSYSGMELYDFDTNTGLLSNPVTLLSNGLEKNYRGCEFSADGTKLYTGHNISGSTNSRLIQWDVSAGSGPAIISSSVNIPSALLNPQALQLAPNGKIYIASNGSPSLSVINNPNAAGLACNFVNNGQSISAVINATLNSYSRVGLPNLITGISNTPCATQSVNNPQSICAGSFYAISNHSYTNAGTYIDTIQNVFNCNGITIVNTQLTTNSLPNLSVNTVSTICVHESLTLTATGANTYTWNSSTSGSQYTTAAFTTPGNVSYSVQLQGKGNAGCVSTNTIALNVLVQACDVGISQQNPKAYSDNIRVYPNPSEMHLTVNFDAQAGISKITIINSLGQTIREEEIEPKNDSFTLETSGLANGIYQLQFKTGAGTITKQFVKN